MFRILLAAVVCFSASALSAPVFASHPLSDDHYDHFACYKVREHREFRAQVQLDSSMSQLKIPPTCRVIGRSLAFCAPVRKSVMRLRYAEGASMAPYHMPGDHQREGRICYRVKCNVAPFEGPLRVQDQFGRHVLRGFTLKRLCTNASVISDVTTTTTTTTTTLPQDPCALVDCAEGHYCRPDCDNPRAAECVPYAPEGGICGGFVPPCKEQLCKPGLECVVPPNIPDIPGICVDTGDGACRVDEDCPHGQVCEPSAPGDPNENVCVPGCHDDKDCPEGAQCEEVVCVTTPCPGHCIPSVEPECRVDDDCPAGQVCEPGPPFFPIPTVCVPGCHEHSQCEEGQHCRHFDCITTPCPGQCVDDPPIDCGKCYSDDDCSDDLYCDVLASCKVACDCPQCAVCAGDCVPRPVTQR